MDYFPCFPNILFSVGKLPGHMEVMLISHENHWKKMPRKSFRFEGFFWVLIFSFKARIPEKIAFSFMKLFKVGPS